MEFVAAFVLFGASILAMSVGVILRGRGPERSCGGTAGQPCACGRQENEACPRT